MTVLFWCSLICFFLTLSATLYLFWGTRQLVNLKDVLPLQSAVAPSVSLIIPACNEGQTLRPALESALALAYPNLEIMVVNDRSTDDTGTVLAELKKAHPALQILTISDLPGGWLGKSHALHVAGMQARGEYLLFTDADILLEKSTLARAMSCMLVNGLDHLSLIFKNISPGGLLNTAIMEGMLGLLLLFKPWKARNPNSRHYMGVGAFNLVRTEAYRNTGGHRKIAMHPIDDIMLGKIIKQQGGKQDCLIGYDFVQVKWYASVRELVRGAMKNLFALYRFRISNVFFALMIPVCFQILPFWALFFTTGATFGLFAGTLVIRLLSLARGLSVIGFPPRQAVWSFVTPYLSVFVSMKAAITTLRNGGITWRGTHYPLDELKKGIRI
jgi:cellulose synthase/poly-beta-1,6-N-acetylglucosamine synthase-like glycosyltransferase